MRAPRALLVLSLVAAASGCGKRPDRSRATTSPASVAAAAGGEADASKPFSRPVVIVMEASDADLEAARARTPEEDFQVIADDLMYYRSAAYEYLEKRGLPVVRLTGHRSLEFMVNGAVRRIEPGDVALLDPVILYDGVHEPRVIAPVDIQLVDEVFPRDSTSPAGSAPASGSPARAGTPSGN